MPNILGLEPFLDAAPWQIAVLAATYAGAFLVKGVFGYGAVPILIVAGSFVLEPHHAVVLAAVSNLTTHLQYLPEGLREGRRGLVWRLAIFVVPAILVGVWVFARLEGDGLSVIAGAIILFSVGLDGSGILEKLAPYVRERAATIGPIFGILAGLMSGIVGAGSVAFLSLYIRVFAGDRVSFRATTILMTAVILVWRTCVLTAAGFVTATVVLEAAILLPFGVLAGWLGGRLSGTMSDRAFFAAYRTVLVLGAGLMVWRGL